MMCKFSIIYSENIFPVEIIYRDEEYSFDSEPSLNSDITLVVGDYLQLGIESTDMAARDIWGSCAHISWKKTVLNPPTYKKGKLILIDNIEPGGPAIQINGSETWGSKFDCNNGWFCIGNERNLPEDSAVEFAINIVSVIDKDSHLKALWWKPKFRSDFDVKKALGITNEQINGAIL